MDFTLTDEQQMLVDTARSLFASEFPATLLRDAVYDPTPDGPGAAAKAFDTHLRDWFALGDESAVDQCLFAEEAGAALVAGPLWSSSALALPVLRGVGGSGECAATADAVASGELTATVAIVGSEGLWAPNREDTKRLVPDAGSVDRIVVVDATSDGGAGAGAGSPEADDNALVSVVEAASVAQAGSEVEAGSDVEAASVFDAARPGISEVESLDRSRPLYDVTVAERPHPEPVAAAALGSALERATVVLAAELVGVARWLRDETIAYVSEREQFGVPVGSFQGLQWKLVDAALRHEQAAAAVAYAAMCLDAGDPDRHHAVHVAKASAGTAARCWARDGLQAHGGIGYTWEHDLHLRLRRAHGSDHMLGDADWHRDRLADLIFQ